MTLYGLVEILKLHVGLGRLSVGSGRLYLGSGRLSLGSGRLSGWVGSGRAAKNTLSHFSESCVFDTDFFPHCVKNSNCNGSVYWGI